MSDNLPSVPGFDRSNLLRYVGWFTFIALGLMAWFFYLERTVFLDAAFQSFTVITQDRLAIQVNRFGAAVTQVFPLVGVRLGWSLENILRAYSMSFVIYPFVLFILLTRVFRAERMALALALFYTLLVSQTFYWIQSELLQGCALVLFFYGIVDALFYQDNRTLDHPLRAVPIYLLMAGLSIVIVFFHPVLFIPFFYIWLFMAIGREREKRKAFYFLPLMAIAVMLFKRYGFPTTAYDKNTIGLALDGLLEQATQFFSLQSTQNFYRFCLTDYYCFPVLFLAVIVFYSRQRNFLKLAYVTGSVLAYLFLVNCTFHWNVEQFYIESHYQVLTIMLTIPLVLDMLRVPRWHKVLIYLIPLVVFIRVVHIGLEHRTFAHRIEIERGMLEQAKKIGGQKFMIAKEDLPAADLLMTWGLPYETLYLSALEHPDSARTILSLEGEQRFLPKNESRTDLFLGSWRAYNEPEIEATGYFHFHDTIPYRKLSQAEAFPKGD